MCKNGGVQKDSGTHITSDGCMFMTMASCRWRAHPHPAVHDADADPSCAKVTRLPRSLQLSTVPGRQAKDAVWHVFEPVSVPSQCLYYAAVVPSKWHPP